MRSVVLASYQGERHIGAQLDSILPQLARDDEVIVSDDASTDGTVAVVSRRCADDSRVLLLANSERAGYVGNFQRAIERSRGDLIYFSDQDDIWLPAKVQRMDLALQSHAFVASDAIVVNDDLESLKRSYFEWRGTRGFSFLSILAKPPIIGATMACRRSYLLSLLPLPPAVPHDFWLSLNAAWDRALGIVTDPLILYRRHPSAVSFSATSLKRPLSTILNERFMLLGSFLGRRIWRSSTPQHK